jgi:hypothetical protein
MGYGAQIGELMAKVAELTGVAMAWKAKSEQQEQEIEYLRECLKKERSRNTAGA